VRALLDMLEPGPREQVREALAQVQMLYARESKTGPEGTGGDGTPEPPSGAPDEGPKVDRPSGLWTPPGT
jgi:hypothetical protein